MGQGFNNFGRIILLGVCFVAALAGCASNAQNFEPLTSIKTDPAPQAHKSPYRIGPGDEVEIKFFLAPELNDRLTVRPDGKISMMFAQDLQAAGLTTKELARDIRTVLASHIKQLDLVVIVRNFASHKAYVGGEVMKPGAVSLTGGESLLQVLSAAGWMKPTGSDTVVVVRRDSEGTEKIYPVDIAQLESGQNMDQNILVLAGDMILVPPSDVAVSDRWVDMYIRQMLPFSPSAGVSYNFNSNPSQQ